MTDDAPDMTAAELALGLLERDDRAAALRRQLAEPAFAADVAWWRDELGELLVEIPDAEPPAALWGRIEGGLTPRSPRAGRLWPSIAGLTTLAAAASLALLVSRPPTSVRVAPAPSSVPAPVFAAAIVPTGTGEALAAVYQADTGAVRLSAANLADARHAAELWVIGGDGVPHSLGLLNTRGTTVLRLTPSNRARLAGAATLAITIEPVGGSPTGQPTGPIVAKGPLSRT